MATVSFKDFSKGQPVNVINNETSPTFKKESLSLPTDNSLTDKVSSEVSTAGKGLYESITGIGKYTGVNPAVRGIQGAAEALSTPLKVAGTVVGDVANKVAPETTKAIGTGIGKVGEAIGGGIDWLGEKIGGTHMAQKFVEQHPDAAKTLEDWSKIGSAGGDIANNILTAEVGIKSAPKLAKEGANIASDVSTLAAKSAEPLTNKLSVVKEKAKDIALNDEKKFWSKPSQIPKAAYNKAREVFDTAKSQGHDIADTLTKNKITSSDIVEYTPTGNRVYNTVDTVEKLRSDAAKISNEMLRPALEKADASGLVPKTPVSEFIKSSIENINKSKLTAEAKDKMISSLNETTISLQKQHPEGLSLTDLHNEKIIRDLNSKYSLVGDISTNMEATKNKAIADAARKMVEEKAPKDIPVKEFNAELAKQYQASNYLESLHGKTVPRSLLSSIAKTASKVVGAAVGQGIGGGIMGGVGGYHIGGMVESLIEGLPNPIKKSLLENLEVTNPEAFTKVNNYLKNLENSPSVAKPMTNINMNTPMSPKSTSFEPKSQTGKLLKTMDESKGGFVKLSDSGKVVNAIDEATKKEISGVVKYLSQDKKFFVENAGLEKDLENLARKYEISLDLPFPTIKNKFMNLLEKTKTK